MYNIFTTYFSRIKSLDELNKISQARKFKRFLDENYGHYASYRYFKYVLTALNNTIYEHDLNIKNYWKKVENIEPDKDVNSLSIAEINYLYRYDFGKDNLNITKDLFLFSYYACGLRYSDVMSIKTDDINIKELTLKKVMVKGKKKKVIFLPIHKRAVSIYLKYKSKLPTLSNQKCNKNLKIIATLMKYKMKLTFHTARSSFATNMANTGINLKSVQIALGHSDISTTMGYIKTIPEDIRKNLSEI